MPFPAAFLARIRDDALAALRFEGQARWLPDAEATPLREAFAREPDRLNALQSPSPAP